MNIKSMQLSFTKLSGKYDALAIQRANGSCENIMCPKQGIIPHDMVHYAVEKIMTARGFLGRVASGEVLSFRMKPELDAESVERIVEVMQADAWTLLHGGPISSAADLIAAYEVACAAREHEAVPLTGKDVAAIRTEMEHLTLAWNAVPVNGVLSLQL
jgi:hypothetical protein